MEESHQTITPVACIQQDQNTIIESSANPVVYYDRDATVPDEMFHQGLNARCDTIPRPFRSFPHASATANSKPTSSLDYSSKEASTTASNDQDANQDQSVLIECLAEPSKLLAPTAPIPKLQLPTPDPDPASRNFRRRKYRSPNRITRWDEKWAEGPTREFFKNEESLRRSARVRAREADERLEKVKKEMERGRNQGEGRSQESRQNNEGQKEEEGSRGGD